MLWIKDLIFPKLIYIFNTIPQTLSWLFHRNEQVDPKIYLKKHRTQNHQNHPEKD